MLPCSIEIGKIHHCRLDFILGSMYLLFTYSLGWGKTTITSNPLTPAIFGGQLADSTKIHGRTDIQTFLTAMKNKLLQRDVVYVLGKGDKSSPTIDEENNFVHCNALHISDAKFYNHYDIN